MTTPLDRAAAVLRSELQDYIPGLNFQEMDRFTNRLASDVIAAAQLPERHDTATELRIANLLTAAMYPTHLGVDGADEKRRRAMDQALTMLGLVDS